MTRYHAIVEHYERCFAEHGDCARGLDWPNLPDLLRRYEVMLGIIGGDAGEASVLDLGCGTAMLYAHLQAHPRSMKIRYSGLDLGSKFIAHCRQKYPEVPFLCFDVLAEPARLDLYDYVVMNGVFTERRGLSFDEMWHYTKAMLRAVHPCARRGFAFNVMSKQVDWEEDHLFHLPLDTLADFLTKELTRDFVIRNDYGLYEYTVYVYGSSPQKHPRPGADLGSRR